MAQRTTRSPSQLVKDALRHLSELTGRTPEGALGIHRDGDDGGWKVMVELLEIRRVPETMDILGCYEVEVDDKGELLGYRRQGRYQRGAVDGDRG